MIKWGLVQKRVAQHLQINKHHTSDQENEDVDSLT